MALRNVVKYGDPILRKKSRTVEVFDRRIATLVEDMFETMYKDNGVGLAAVQVGILKRIVVIDCGDGPVELINPEIVKTEGEQCGQEGCLSLPGRYETVRRPQKVQVKGQDREGKWHVYTGEDLKARAFCHEIDHLDGVLFIDRMDKTVSYLWARRILPCRACKLCWKAPTAWWVCLPSRISHRGAKWC